MVRKFFLAFFSAVLFNIAANAGNCKPVHEFENGVCLTSFNVTVEEPGDYYLGAWTIPVQLVDGSFEEYQIVVNKVNTGKYLTFSNGDWQSSISNSIYLKKGTNVISFAGGSILFPNVSDIKVSKSIEDAGFSNDAYSSYQKNALEEIPDMNIDSISIALPQEQEYVAFNDNLKFLVTEDNQIILNAAYDGVVTVKFVSAENGRLMAKEKYSCAKGKNVLLFGAMPNGVYLVIVEMGGLISTKKFLK
ncbi:MAG: hypothetical protein KBT32_04625 [Bacteroidales bacterium]|nr:hypothetical protein [Candidatus Physcocola equi]